MVLKSSINLGTRINGSSDLQIWNNHNMRNTALKNSLLKTNPSHRKRSVTGRRRRMPKNGAISKKAPGTTPKNVAQNSHWCLRSKSRSRTLILNLIQKILIEGRSSMQTPLLLSRPQQFNRKNQHILKRGSAFFIQSCGWRGPRCILLLIAEARRTSSQQGCQTFGIVDNTTRTAIQHQVASPGTRSSCEPAVSIYKNMIFIKKNHLFDKSNHQKSDIIIACTWYRHVEVLSTPLCLKDTDFDKNLPFSTVCMPSTSARA